MSVSTRSSISSLLQQRKRDKQELQELQKLRQELEQANSRRLFNAYPIGQFPTSSAPLTTENNRKSTYKRLTSNPSPVPQDSTPASSASSKSVKKPKQKKKGRAKSPSDEFSSSSDTNAVVRPNRPPTYSSKIVLNNEIVVIDCNENVLVHSLISRNGVWFLDVCDLDKMDSTSTFQYIARRPSHSNDLILTRVPELRHLVYVKCDEEGRPYPVVMRRVSPAKWLSPSTATTSQMSTIKEEKRASTIQQRSFWEALSITLRRTIMYSNEESDSRQPPENASSSSTSS